MKVKYSNFTKSWEEKLANKLKKIGNETKSKLSSRFLSLDEIRGDGGYSYLKEPMWWAGMITMIVGEGANFAAYAYAPAILVTPLGALSIIFSAVLAHCILDERLHMFGVVGCIICLVGSVTIVLHAPLEKDIDSVKQIWYLATEPGTSWFYDLHLRSFGYCYRSNFLVMAVKAVGIALKLSFSGSNQFIYLEPWFFTVLVIVFCIMQLIYLNKALDTFNTAVVSPVYYVMFTFLTILASVIMFKEWDSQDASEIMTEVCGFVTILCGTFLLHKTKDMGGSPAGSSPVCHSLKSDSSSKLSEIGHLAMLKRDSSSKQSETGHLAL
ncbi:hypothetical protein DH2020_043395 [Rehmannia glutinosa]|uniref:Probable magnesium transporter n=1 Tax=Rehmannia glutinosa TaxID=99300 RepID=A0ABR0UJT3_REHGL